MAKNKTKFWVWPAIIIIYLLIFFEYPFGMAFSQLVFHRALATTMQPSYLLLWGLVRIGLILPLTFAVITSLEPTQLLRIRSFTNYRRSAKVTFWSTFAFVIVGILFYQYFLRTSELSFVNGLLNAPVFLAYAVSNALVEETFFRGLLLTKLSSSMSFWVANTINAALFAAIHFINPMSSHLWLFVGLTFCLGLLWGYTTKRYHSLMPGVAMHVIADIFVAVSLF